VDEKRVHLNRVLITPPTPAEMREIAKARRDQRDTQRAMKSNAAIATAGIITFGSEAAQMFEALSQKNQDRAFRDLAEAVAVHLNTSVHALVVHLDEATIHAHVVYCAYDHDGVPLFWPARAQAGGGIMQMDSRPNRRLRCAIYTRKSSEEGLDMEFNSLDAQREACEAYIASQKSEGWVATRERYDDGGFSGGNLDRPGLKQLLTDIDDGLIDVVVVYKIDRLSRSLMDFSKLVEVFDRNGVTFVSVTQSFNTTTSMGRLTLNILLSFAQFEL